LLQDSPYSPWGIQFFTYPPTTELYPFGLVYVKIEHSVSAKITQFKTNLIDKQSIDHINENQRNSNIQRILQNVES
jgi:hypothetical protein